MTDLNGSLRPDVQSCCLVWNRRSGSVISAHKQKSPKHQRQCSASTPLNRASTLQDRVRSYTETRRSLPSLIGVANGFNQELDAYLGFTVFIDPQLICSSMGKIDDCALLAEFSIVDHHNHTYWCLRASLSPSSQEATGRGQPSGCSSEGSHHWRFCFCRNQAHTKWPDQQKASPLQVKHRGWAGCSRPCCGISP